MSVKPELGGPDTNFGLENCDTVDCKELTGCVQEVSLPCPREGFGSVV